MGVGSELSERCGRFPLLSFYSVAMSVSDSEAAREAQAALGRHVVAGGGWIGAGDLLLTLASLQEREIQVASLCELAWEMADMYGASSEFLEVLAGLCGER